MLNCPKCAADPGFIRKPIVDNVFITGDKTATCRLCGETFDFHYGQVPSERDLKAIIYQECDQNLILIASLKDRFFWSETKTDEQKFAVYYNLVVYLNHGEVFPPKSPVVITIQQPYATLYAAGLKLIETRPSASSYRGTMLIHAAKHTPKEKLQLCETEPFYSALASLGISSFSALPSAAIIGSVDLYHCAKIVHPDTARTYQKEIEEGKYMLPPPDPELSFGYYQPNYYAWLGFNHRQLEEPLPYTNGQGYYLRLRENIKYSDLKFKK